MVSEEDYGALHDSFVSLAQIFGNPKILEYSSFNQQERVNTLKSLIESARGIVLATPESLAAKTNSPARFKSLLKVFSLGDTVSFETLFFLCMELGYARCDFVEERGQFARRGEVFDIWPVDREGPFRIVFNLECVESIREFDSASQRSGKFLNSCSISPAKENADSYLSDYLPRDTKAFIDSPEYAQNIPLLKNYNLLINSPVTDTLNAEDANFRPFVRWGANYKLFLNEFAKFAAGGYKSMIFCANQGEKERVEDIFSENLRSEVMPPLYFGALADGFFSPNRKIAVFAAQEILYKRKQVSFPKFKSGRRLEGLWEISKNDYVVHEKYGIGRYLGLRRITRPEQESEYLCIEYKGGDKLYIPPDDFGVVKKYVGLEGQRPRLYSLDTGAWEKATHRAKEGAKALAEELLKLYAQRQGLQGYSFPRETLWEKELADSFPFSETEDQQRSIEEVMRDLEQPRPMERLVCGDVGFGKTEVAVRAAFKVAVNSRQVAVLVPTTVLAEQHYNTFSNRLSPFPVKIALLSRFQTKKEQAKIIEDIKAGELDIVIGTHRLIQKDISFKDLGLLIIDEEHRFGVKQKEKIKAMRKNIDVLMMTATPIPRTLSFALSNLKDLSVIETPPYGRLPIETHLSSYDEKAVKTIIAAEMSRGGQVYYVHNRVETILAKADELKKLVPEARFGVVHGQMGGHQIEKVMWDFMHKKLDALIATTIIESGLDIPSVNTIIIEEAENFGLSQLYQLRGRVGREKQKAFCYLFYTAKTITEEASKRLEALQEFGELGSGFRLALRDLEIRGAGNILGAEQHGFVREIGFELYSRLIDEASKKLKGAALQEGGDEEARTAVDFMAPAFIPSEYIEAEDVRILFYRKLGLCATEDDIAAVKEEMLDRFGRMPGAVENLLEITKIKQAARKQKVKSIVEDKTFVSLYFEPGINVAPEKVLSMASDYSGLLEFIRGESYGIRLRKDMFGAPVIGYIKAFVSGFKRYL